MISVENVTKSYGRALVLDDVSLVARPGEVYGLVGHNGAGKTTLLKIIAGVYLPDAGHVSFAGDEDPAHAPFIVADEPYFMSQATPARMRAFLRGYYPSWSDRTFDALLDLFALERDAKIAGFSKGMQRQMALLLGFATKTRFLLLDESFDGLDVSKRDVLKRLLRTYARVNDATVLLSSHNMEELQDVSDRVGVIEGHRLVLDRPVSELGQGELRRLFFEGEEVDDARLEQIFA